MNASVDALRPAAAKADIGRSEPKFSLRNVGQEYPVEGQMRRVLEDVSFDVGVNETVAIIGPTGTGKSTLLRMLAGFEAPAVGEATIWSDGRQRPISPSPRIGYLFQQPALFPWMRVRDNILFGALHARVHNTDAELHAGADYYIDQVGLGDAQHLFPYQISGGMRARTALARVFLTHPEVLLMDESFGALDALTRREMYTLLRDLMANSPELTTLMVTHDVDEAITLCRTIVIISGSPGRLSAIYRSDLAGRDLPITELQSEPDYAALKKELLSALGKRRNSKREDN